MGPVVTSFADRDLLIETSDDTTDINDWPAICPAGPAGPTIVEWNHRLEWWNLLLSRWK